MFRMFRLFAGLALLLPIVTIGCSAGPSDNYRQLQEYAKEPQEPGIVQPSIPPPRAIWSH